MSPTMVGHLPISGGLEILRGPTSSVLCALICWTWAEARFAVYLLCPVGLHAFTPDIAEARCSGGCVRRADTQASRWVDCKY